MFASCNTVSMRMSEDNGSDTLNKKYLILYTYSMILLFRIDIGKFFIEL